MTQPQITPIDPASFIASPQSYSSYITWDLVSPGVVARSYRWITYRCQSRKNRTAWKGNGEIWKPWNRSAQILKRGMSKLGKKRSCGIVHLVKYTCLYPSLWSKASSASIGGWPATSIRSTFSLSREDIVFQMGRYEQAKYIPRWRKSEVRMVIFVKERGGKSVE